jgi:tripartite-type tricarboxylate transporter receptor subunit TctC
VIRKFSKFPRRQFLRLAGTGAVASILPRRASALGYPARPVRIVVGFAAGGTQDIVARLMAQWLSERLGQPFLIENRAGGGGNIGAQAVASAIPDGYTLLLVGLPNAINASLYEKLGFSIERDIAPVAALTRTPLVMVVEPGFPARNVAEFIAYAKANPGKILFASPGIGTPQHVAGELFKMMAGIDMLHVPYRGEPPAITDLLGGQVQVYFGALPGTIAHVRAGRLRALAMTTAARSPALPDVPVVGDVLPGYEASGWNGIGAPGNTPADIVAKLNAEINAGLGDHGMQARLAALGAPVLAGSPADFGKLIAGEIEKWAKVVKFSGAKAE